MPEASWPSTAGTGYGKRPSMKCRSLWHRPAAAVRTSTSWPLGFSICTSSIVKGALAACKTAAFIGCLLVGRYRIVADPRSTTICLASLSAFPISVDFQIRFFHSHGPAPVLFFQKFTEFLRRVSMYVRSMGEQRRSDIWQILGSDYVCTQAINNCRTQPRSVSDSSWPPLQPYWLS